MRGGYRRCASMTPPRKGSSSMSLIARRWIVSTGELWLPDGSPTSKPDPETEDWVVLAEDYDALAEQLRGAVSLLAELGQCANTHDVFPVDTTVSVHVP